MTDALLDTSNIRLRFENAPGVESRQDVFIDNMTAIPEPSTWAAILGVGGLALAVLRRRKSS